MSDYLKESISVLEHADQLCSQQQVDDAFGRMAAEIKNELEDKNPLVICIMNGGLIPAGMLIPRLDFPLHVNYMHATRYRNNTSGGELDWVVRPSQSLIDRNVLLIDDVLDEGLTLEAIIHDCEKAGAKRVYSAVLVEKIRERPADIKCDFVGLKVEDRYLFGYGMDYKGYLRNAAGIYAVKDM